MIRLLSTLFLLIIINIPVNAQISYGGLPASFFNTKKSGGIVPFVEMESVSNFGLLMTEMGARRGVMKPFHFAKTFDVNINPEKVGVWTEDSDGTKIWRVGIRSRDAYSLNIIFNRFRIPDRGELFIYSTDKEKVLGAFTANNEKSSGFFAVRPLAGDEIIVEYNEPRDVSFSGELNISSVNHDYKNAFGNRPIGEADSCNIDVYCEQGELIEKDKQGVVRLIISGRELCTGTMINNTDEDKTPYLITAGHCIENVQDASQTVFYFNYESPDCGKGLGSIDGHVDQTLSGSILKARSDSLDFALLEMDDLPPPEYRPYYAGWDMSDNTPPSTYSIHHPKADVKKIAIDDDPPSIGSFNDNYIQDAFWWIRRWDKGTTQEGSSGAPLFNQDGKIIGTLTGGMASCFESINDYFSMVNKQWDYFSPTEKQLKNWLDPGNTGLNSIGALDPYADKEECRDSLFSNSKFGEKYILDQLDDGGYISGKNSLKPDSYAERFKLEGTASISAISFAAGKAVTGANSSSLVFTIYEADKLTGYPGFELASITILLDEVDEGVMNFLEFDSPVEVTDDYYIGFDINYSQPSDTFAIYHSPGRNFESQNTAFVKIGGNWERFNKVPQYDINTSLLIKSHACVTFETEIPDTIISDTRYQVFYPDFGLANYVYLRDTENEGWADVSILDITGRRLILEERYLSLDPILVSIGNNHSGIYFVEVKSDVVREVFKVQMVKGR